MEIQMYENPAVPFFDENRNRLFSDKASIFIKRICVINNLKKFFLQLLAYIILVLALLSFIFLMVFSFLKKDFHDIGTLWKYWLGNWVILQLVSIFILIGIYLPCCVEAFLSILFNYTVKWAHGLRPLIDSIHGD